MEITCIMCPRGCQLEVTKIDDKIEVTGNACPRGAIYGEKEVTAPERMITTIKRYKDKTITLKSNNPVPKGKVFECLREIKQFEIISDLKIGDILIDNIAGTDCNIVVTGISKWWKF